ncbi:MAG: hypothetical protein J6P09_00515 [Methanobrevibacter sp.]|nr:hypothetical protein [Methanobrevibacter sp.]
MVVLALFDGLEEPFYLWVLDGVYHVIIAYATLGASLVYMNGSTAVSAFHEGFLQYYGIRRSSLLYSLISCNGHGKIPP